MASPTFTLRAANGLESELQARGESLGSVALRDLRRYYDQLARAVKDAALTPPEWSFLTDITLGSFLDDALAEYIWAEAEDAGEAYDEKWGIDGRALARKLRAMPAFTRLAITDQLDRSHRAGQLLSA